MARFLSENCLEYIPPLGFIKLWIAFMFLTGFILLGQEYNKYLLSLVVALKMTFKFFMVRQSMDEVKLHEMDNLKTKKEAIQQTIYVILIGLFYGADFLTNAYVQKCYTLDILDPTVTILSSEIFVDFFFIKAIPYKRIWDEEKEEEVKEEERWLLESSEEENSNVEVVDALDIV